MKKVLLFLAFGLLVFSCKDKVQVKSATTSNDNITTTMNLPYKADFPVDWNSNVSDADFKMVLMSYKDWENNNMEGLSKAMGDSVTYDNAIGLSQRLSNAALMQQWKTNRDSLSSAEITMRSWNKMYSPSTKDAFVVVWYDEKDTYKDGRVDLANYHDINQVKDGKIVWFVQYKRPLKLPK
ncbi:MAG: hypothetical protein ACM3VS_06120 [Candidatus Dadabacteria bacterium]